MAVRNRLETMRSTRVIHRGDRPCLCGASVAAVDTPALVSLEEGIGCTRAASSFLVSLQPAAARKARFLTATNTAGMPIKIAQQNLGYASLATTTVYVTTEQRRRMQAVAQNRGQVSPILFPDR